MNLSPSLGAGGVGRLTVLLQDGERVLCRGWRDDGDGDGTAVLAVLSASEHPAPAFVDQLAHEYGLKDELDGRSAARPLALVREHGRTMLLLEDPGGRPLARLLGRPMEMGRFLRFAAGLSAALSRVHEHGLIHKDIKPANVLVDFATGQVWLTGFGIAARLPRERQSPEPPELVAGTLAYMAPEQTGRMNRSIDSRSDLYSLGVTLYEMLTGALPFMASDPMEWVHCHIARQPVPPVACLRHRVEAARQDRRRALPDRGRPGARPPALPCCMGNSAPDPRLPAGPTGHARPAFDSRETVRARAGDRDLARRLRPRRHQRPARASAGLRLFRHRQVRRRQRAAQGAGAVARPFCLRQVRSVQARHPLCHAGASLSEPDPLAPGQERRRTGRLARRAARR